MSWTGSEKLRRPQGIVECPERFRGNRRYVSEDETHRNKNARPLGGLMPFGKFKGKPISTIPESYLNWLLTISEHNDLKSVVRNELDKRKGNHERTTH